MKKKIKRGNLLPWFLEDHSSLPAWYLKDCEEFFEWLKKDNKENKETVHDIRVNPQDNIYKLKSILLNFTENEPFELRFRLDNESKI